MHTKLTLNVEEEIIQDAKKYAKKNRISLSKIVEKYLKNITTGLKETSKTTKNTVTHELSGIINDTDKNVIKDAKLLYLKDKYKL